MIKVIFIHIAKNCGNSIKRVLVSNKNIELCDLGRLFHVQISLEDYEIKNKDLKPYFKFTIIRNPWERLVSYYNYMIKSQEKHIEFINYLEKKYNKKSSIISEEIIEKELENFEYLKYSKDYIEELKKRNMFSDRIKQIKKNVNFYNDKINSFRKYNFKEYWKNIINNTNDIHLKMGKQFLLTTQYDKIKVKNIDNQIDMILRYENINEDYQKLKKKLNLSDELPIINNNDHKSYQDYYDDELKELLLPYLKKDLDFFSYKF